MELNAGPCGGGEELNSEFGAFKVELNSGGFEVKLNSGVLEAGLDSGMFEDGLELNAGAFEVGRNSGKCEVELNAGVNKVEAILGDHELMVGLGKKKVKKNGAAPSPPACPFHRRRMCRYGEVCRYVHVVDAQPQAQAPARPQAAGAAEDSPFWALAPSEDEDEDVLDLEGLSEVAGARLERWTMVLLGARGSVQGCALPEVKERVLPGLISGLGVAEQDVGPFLQLLLLMVAQLA